MTNDSLTDTHRTAGTLAAIGEFFARIVDALVAASAAGRCAHEVERLMAMSDAELARRGIKREDIVRHAFARYLGV
jgi:hypothetical protein